MNDEFYVGYLPKAPASLARWVKRAVAMLAVAGLGAGALLISGQPPFAACKFEFGVLREYTGVIEEWPYPILRTPGESFLLVSPGKHGLAERVKGLQGRSVHLQGSLIDRGSDHMLEVPPESLSEVPRLSLPSAAATVSLGPVTLRGEIADTKCYLGVMNPGEGKVHRDCAVRCISGGAPPALIARDAAGETRVLLLTGSDGRALNREVLPFVAEPVEIQGELVRAGDHLVLKADPARFRRDSGINSAL